MSRVVYVLALAAVYCAIIGSIKPWDIGVGVALGILFSPSGRSPRRRSMRRAGWRALIAWPMLAAAAVIEITRGTWQMALIILGFRPSDRQGIVEVPIGDRTPFGITVSGLLFGLSPGTVLVSIDRVRKVMCFHLADASDPEGARRHMDRFYERYQRPVFP